MAKTSLIMKNKKILSSNINTKNIRSKLKIILTNNSATIVERLKAQKVLDSIKSSSLVRYRNRCQITGRPRGYRGDFGISRNKLREAAAFGLICGLKKIS